MWDETGSVRFMVVGILVGL
jgi:hypothetical protein